MNKKFFYKIFVFAMSILLSTNFAKAQVTIGDNTPPYPFSVLELINQQEQYKGLRLPHLNNYGVEALKDSILSYSVTNPGERANGLMVFNTDVGCIQVWETSDFWSVCGDPRPAQIEIGNCSDIKAHGIYTETVAVTASNYISVPIKVTTPGTYDIHIEPNPGNGYYFAASGTFPNASGTDAFILNIPASGKPTTAQTDHLKITLNGTVSTTCDPTIEVQTAQADYRILSVVAYPRPYPLQQNLVDPSKYYAEVKLTVSKAGHWDLSTSTVNGYSFAGNGELVDASGFNPSGNFPQTVTVSVPVVAGQALVYNTTGYDQFVMSTNSSASASSYPFPVYLAGVGFTLSCANIQTPTGLQQGVALTGTEKIILNNITVTSPGETVITATFAGIRFTSLDKTYTTGNTQNAEGTKTKLESTTTSITLVPEYANQKPSQSGSVPVSIESTEGGIASPGCSPTINISQAVAKFSDLRVSGYTNNANYLLDPYDNSSTPCSVILTASVTEAGSYTLTSSTENSVTYSATGTLTAGTQAITLVPTEGTPFPKNVKQNYTLTYTKGDGTTGTLTFTINYIYRTINILSIGSRPTSTYDRPASANNGKVAASVLLYNKENFGPGGVVGVQDVRVYDMGTTSGGPSATDLKNYINQYKIDVIYVSGYVQTRDAAAAQVYRDFVDKKNGFICYADQLEASVERFMQGMYGSSVDCAHHVTMYHPIVSAQKTASSAHAVMKGPFMDFTASANQNKAFGDDCGDGSSVKSSAVQSSMKIIARTDDNDVWMFIDDSKNLFFCGDYAWANGNTSYQNDSNAWPASFAGGVPAAHPMNSSSWTGSTAGGGDGKVYNAYMYCNVMAYAINWAANNCKKNVTLP
ncbi:MAG: hypothetical protein LBR64_02770 [Dysgonamonadaceae bacterium]|jgi:hypothetical protein|nr:hypothetical protein [Dysgonamonadaceae bacterium]